jgi:hypothetical protein
MLPHVETMHVELRIRNEVQYSCALWTVCTILFSTSYLVSSLTLIRLSDVWIYTFPF